MQPSHPHSHPGLPLPHLRQWTGVVCFAHTAATRPCVDLTGCPTLCHPAAHVHKCPQHCRPKHMESSLLSGPQGTAMAEGCSGRTCWSLSVFSCVEPASHFLYTLLGPHNHAVYEGGTLHVCHANAHPDESSALRVVCVSDWGRVRDGTRLGQCVLNIPRL